MLYTHSFDAETGIYWHNHWHNKYYLIYYVVLLSFQTKVIKRIYRYFIATLDKNHLKKNLPKLSKTTV